jgi:hypothetical protein
MLKTKRCIVVGMYLAVLVVAAAPVSQAATPEFEAICPKGGLYTVANCTCMAGKATAEEIEDMAYFFASLDDPSLLDLQKAGRGSAAVTKHGAACAT